MCWHAQKHTPDGVRFVRSIDRSEGMTRRKSLGISWSEASQVGKHIQWGQVGCCWLEVLCQEGGGAPMDLHMRKKEEAKGTKKGR
jgi:hypothetical protein